MTSIVTTPAGVEGKRVDFSIEATTPQLKTEWIQDVLEGTHRKSKRVRKLPSDLMVHLLVAMGLHPDASINNTWKILSHGFRGKLEKHRQELPASAAVTQARDRLGLKPMAVLFHRQGQELKQRHEDKHRYKGLEVVGIDGSTLKVPDTPENRANFGAPGSGRGHSAFPAVRIVLLLLVTTHIAVAAALGAYGMSELPLAMTLLMALNAGTLVLIDRRYCSYLLWWRFLGQKCHFITRRKRCMRFRRLRKLGEGAWLVKFFVPDYLKREHPELPKSLTLRLMRYQMPGFRPSWLITSLEDPELYLREELVHWYHLRWELDPPYTSRGLFCAVRFG